MSRAWPLVLLCVGLHAESLFDGRSLQGWKETPFSQHGAVRVENGAIALNAGSPLTGITWAGEFLRSNYEIRYEAARMKGGDFFAVLTVPVGDSYCPFVSGGWVGDV